MCGWGIALLAVSAADDGGLRFDYDADFRDASDATPLSMSMPLTRDQHASAAVTASSRRCCPSTVPLANAWNSSRCVAPTSSGCWPTSGVTFPVRRLHRRR
jgi:hypothetical protein